MNVLMGAPNIVRGGSHSGNVAAHQLASHGLLDILSSDYYPPACWMPLSASPTTRTTPLPCRRRFVWSKSGAGAGPDDRGVIAEGKRADLVLAHRRGEHIHIDHVWRQGKRVF
jgi:alpha-D-ribose 1-methylphosphonate 5-triphosphate diphosphatase